MPNMPNVYKSTQIAKEMFKLATEGGRTLTPMQLIKLVYLAHSWMLALYGRPLIKEAIEAWKYGPVIPTLYKEIKHYRSNPVTNINCEENVEFDEPSIDIIRQVYNKYGHLNGIQLSIVTHEENSPWQITWKNGNTIISNDLITDYYQRLASNE